MLEALVEALLDALGLTGVVSDRHRGSIAAIFIALLVALVGAIVLAIVVVATGRV